MTKAEEVYGQLVSALADGSRVLPGKLFGKPRLMANGKAFVAQHHDNVVFKLPSPQREEALAFDGATLWDPSGKGRQMKEWIAVPATAPADFRRLAEVALAYTAVS